MNIPKYDEIMPVALRELAKQGVSVINWKELEQPLASFFNLSAEDLTIQYASGNGKMFLDRISWALSYLSIVKLIERPKRGYCQITDAGREFARDHSGLKDYVKEKIAEHEAQKRKNKLEASETETAAEISTLNSETTPDEALNQAALSIRESIIEEILDTILSKTPYEFEKLVVDLLDKMGYGGLVKDAGQVTQQSNDGGIDGIIKEDILGLGRIHIQAKRYKRENTIGRESIQNFVGALAVAQSNKGVFITTSSFSKPALDYVLNLNGTTNVVLIDGQQLAAFIYEFNLGMQTEQTVVIKRLDTDFWDRMKDELVS